ncbi:hypothetical protein NEOLI_001763 [Neolecta irregularis DAH-3]|uniref:Uncharacterized protein n=1 Tax=Neolecta irregularis (strain DAH-3) TaxID=1198029 RepID=A0A1U7LW31_NEOID|nr:hypothetical protein NEOLI_001763 [Neolecta irregularis DAH-3]|eukprot:OLL26885.1 hypothetical protein NEOLI_001763 [Neolecta irregularis DAH-3]
MLHIFLKSTGPMSTDDIGPYEMELESGQLFMRLALAAYANLEVPITHPQAVLGPVIAAKRVTTNLGLWKFTDRKLSMDYNNMMINFSVCSTQRPSIFQLFWHLTDTLEFNPLSPENTYCEPVVLYTYQGLDEWANGLGV